MYMYRFQNLLKILVIVFFFFCAKSFTKLKIDKIILKIDYVTRRLSELDILSIGK